MYNSPLKEKLLEALEFAEKMALSTVFNDTKLKKSLFTLGSFYKNICDGKSVNEKAVQKAIDDFYKIDPDMIEIMKGKPEAYAKVA